ncbi:hypothetical protein [Geomonas agri]|nr:hypothetical protein [Geomonas agri]
MGELLAELGWLGRVAGKGGWEGWLGRVAGKGGWEGWLGCRAAG